MISFNIFSPSLLSVGRCFRHAGLLMALLVMAGCHGNSEKETHEDDTVISDTLNAPAEGALADSEPTEEKAPQIPLITDPHIIVDKPNLELRVVKGGNVIFKAPITCGRVRGQKTKDKDRRTPEGNFRIVSIEDATHKLYRTDDGRLIPHVYGPWFLRLDANGWEGIGIHGTNAPGQIARRLSKGCIRMLNKDVAKLHEYARVGMQVIVLPDNVTDPDMYFPPAKAPASKEEVAIAEEAIVETNGDVEATSAPTATEPSPQTEPSPAPAPATPTAPAQTETPAATPQAPAE